MAWQDEMDRIAMDMSTMVQVWSGGCIVEGHKGLLTCTPTEVEVRRRRGRIHITGSDLVVADVTRTQIWVRGRVEAVVWHE